MTTGRPIGRANGANRAGVLLAGAVAVGITLGWTIAAPAQFPGLPAEARPAPAPKADPTRKPVPAKGTPGAVFTATSGPIHVDQKVDDDAIRRTLVKQLGKFPGVRAVGVQATEGDVELEGHADDDDTISQVTLFAQKVDGVRLVLNLMKTDAEVLTGRQLAAKALNQYLVVLEQNWLLALLAIAFALGFGALARAFARYSETLLAPFVGNPLLRSVVGSVLSSLIVLAGVLIGLSVLNLTHAVVSVLGLAGVIGLALGFAFRDIAENFIASMLLGLRRPFQIGDFITVAGKSGSVLSLDTRATTMITPEGDQVRIPNAVIYKETLVNASTTPNTLGKIEVMVPYGTSTADALGAVDEALRATDGLLQEPPPRALVQALEADGVRIRASFWMPTRGIDGDKIQSDIRLRIKVGLQKAGVLAAPGDPAPAAPGRAPVAIGDAGEGGQAAPAPADENLRKDAEAAEAATARHDGSAPSPIDHAIRQAKLSAAAEGNNLLVNGKS